MDQSVLIENGARQKGFVAVQTLVRTFTRVTLANVIVQVWPNGESTIASFLSAFEWFYSWIKREIQIET